jgi:transcriptional regulator with XRE-family HTH domain
LQQSSVVLYVMQPVGESLNTRKIGAVDIHVGRRIRAARLSRALSQEKLADSIGVSFQQIQKYENGANRIGTGRLHSIATVLQVPVAYFFEGLDEEQSRAGKTYKLDAITEALATKEGVRIAIALSRIQNPEMRRRIADLLEAVMASESHEAKPRTNV